MTNKNDKNILAENMRRFRTKNLAEQSRSDAFGRIKPDYDGKPGQTYGTTPTYKQYDDAQSKTLTVGHDAIKTGTSIIDPNNADVRNIIRQLQSVQAGSQINIIGSASAVGNDNPAWGPKKNKQLATDRANALIKILKNKFGNKFEFIASGKVGNATKAESPEALQQQSVAVQIKTSGGVPGGVERDNTSVSLNTGNRMASRYTDDGDGIRDVKWKRVCIKVADGMALDALLDLLNSNKYKGMYSVNDYFKK